MGRLKIFLLFTAFSLIIFWPVFLGKVNLNGNLLVSFYPPYGQNLPYKNTGWDQLRIYFPFYQVTLEAIKHFQIPLWNPYAFSGHPHMADFQTAVFYPLNIFGLILPQVEFWHLLRITPTILGSFFMFLYLRNLRSFSFDKLRIRMTGGGEPKLSNTASIFGALTFGFSPFILTWGEEVVMSPHSIVWLPLILYSTDRYLGSLKKKYLALIMLSTAFSFFGGYIQTTIYMLGFVAAYLVLKSTTGTKSITSITGFRIIAAFVLGAGIAAIQLLPSAELFFSSARSQVTLRETLFKFLLPPETILTYFAPDFFGHPATHNFFRRGSAQYYEGIMFVGAAALVFAIFAILAKWRASNFVKFLTVSVVLALLSTFDWPGAKVFLSLPIPFLSSSIPNRILFIPAFCLSILAAMGLEAWLSQKSREIFRILLLFSGVYLGLAIVLLSVKIFNFPYFQYSKFATSVNVLVSLRNLAIPILIFGFSAALIVIGELRGQWKRKLAVLIMLFASLNIFLFAKKYMSFSDRKYVFPDTPILQFIKQNQGIYRTWGLGEAYFENNLATQYGIYFPEGYDSLNNRSYGEFTFAMQGNQFSDYTFRADAGLGRASAVELLQNENKQSFSSNKQSFSSNKQSFSSNKQSFSSNKQSFSSNRRKLIDLLGVKYLIVKKEDLRLAASNNFEKVYDGGEYAVFENKQVMPRVFLASNYEGPPRLNGSGQVPPELIEKERRKLIMGKLLSPDFDYRNVLILEKPAPISSQFGDGSVEVVRYDPQEVIVKTKSDQPKLLFMSDNYYSGWKATVDGDKTEILRADYTFRAVPLTAGEHIVRFYFESDIVRIGEAVTIVSILVLLYLTSRRNPLVG